MENENCSFDEPEGFVLDENPAPVNPETLRLTRAQLTRLEDDNLVVVGYHDTIKDTMRLIIEMYEYIENKQAGPQKAKEVLAFLDLLIHQYENYAGHHYLADMALEAKNQLVTLAGLRFKPRNHIEPLRASIYVSSTLYNSCWNTIAVVNNTLFAEELPNVWSQEFNEHRMAAVANAVLQFHVDIATSYLKPYLNDTVYVMAKNFKADVMQDKDLREQLLQLPPQLRESEVTN